MPPRCSTTARLGCALVLCTAASLAIAEITTGPPSPTALAPVDPGIRFFTGAGTDDAGRGGPWTDRVLLAQASREALFAAEKAESPAGARWSGFLEGTAAYTYENPSHWSRAVARLQLVGQGELAEGVKWKVGARIDADPVYFTSDFYRDDVKRDQRFDAFFRENYIDFSKGDWEFRLGAQQIVWGEVVGLFFADVVSARDMRDFLLPSFDVIRIPQWAARAEYFAGDAHVELIWIPVPTFDNIGKPGSEFYPAPLPWPTPDGVADLFRPPERPSRTLANSNYGIRANTLVSGWDLSGFYYRSFNTQPTFYREATGDAAQPFEFRPRHDRIWQVGGTVSKDLGDMVLRGEVVYTDGQGFAVADLAAPEFVVRRSTFDYIVGLDFSLPRDSRVNVQVFQRVYSDRHDDLAIQNGAPGASLFLSTKLTDTLEPQLLWIQYFRDGGGLIRPRLNWHAADNLTLSAGVDVFTGPADGYFGRYDNRDRVYAEFRYAF
ncbi:MAG TPA: DUF1302 family protein [Gemmatimonadaceae bacterium]|nr:DUF1302 family protein [Gemmatimonadaceae bacterium]